ncbi:MAG: hypothetical protein AAB535_03450 [Patescibacteria group bacterium]
MVSKQLLEELKEILQEEFGVVPEPQDLSEFGNMLVQIFEALSTVNKPEKQIIETTQP